MSECTVFSANLGSTSRPLRQPWQWCVGSGHATLALRADWQLQLQQARQDLGFRHVRFHGILDDDMGTLVNQNDKPLYSFFNIDRIFDFLLSIGMKPVIELSFMPRMLASGNDIAFRYQGNITAPRDPAQWAELVRRLASHLVGRYGIDEVSLWPFECWNEPNLKAFWRGDQQSYFEFYGVTSRAIKEVNGRLRIGGPVSSGNLWIDDFVHYCSGTHTAYDFISTHYYQTDPFGQIDTDTESQLADSPPGVMRKRASEARSSTGELPLYYTEWSISSNPRDPMHDSSFAAAFAARIAMSVDDLVDGYSYWTFSDIFEENYFPSTPFHGGFGMMNLYGIPKPIYRAFQMLRALGDRQIEVAGAKPNVEVWVGSAAESADTHVVMINQAMPRHAIGAEPVVLKLLHSEAFTASSASISRIDADNANPQKAWRALGSPEYLLPGQIEQLMAESLPAVVPIALVAGDGFVEIRIVLAPQSVNHLCVQWRTAD